jgi:osmoprotectant transport system permease protein
VTRGPARAAGPLLAQTERPLFEWSWVTRNAASIWDATVEHLFLTSTSVGIGLAVSLVLAVLSIRWRRLYGPIIAAGGLLYTIPSLAAFALLPRSPGLTATTAIIALTSYTILILVRNVVTAIDGVPPRRSRPPRAWATGLGGCSGRSSCRSPCR